VPIVVGALAGWRGWSRWILAGAVIALMLLDFAFDEERWSDLPFFVIVGVILFGIGLLVRFIATRIRRRSA
jgi:sugar phosphate permease